MIQGETVRINGDGETSRDFCFVDNAVQANLLAATAEEQHKDEVYNVACNARTSLNELFDSIAAELAKEGVAYDKRPDYGDFRPGDVRHSQADISKAGEGLGYMPTHSVGEGLAVAMSWYSKNLAR